VARDPTSDGVGRLVIRLARELRTAADRQLAEYGLTMQQAELLFAASTRGEISPGKLTPLLLTDEAGVSRLVDRLEAKGLVRTRANEHDRRALTLDLTPSGRRMTAKIWRLRSAANRRVKAGIAESELEQVRAVLLRISKNIAEMPEVLT
jgi:DNA-binding MarR family transcriptional regulator